jgi:hypothetical protein
MSVYELTVLFEILHYPSKTACNGSQLDSNALVTALGAHCLATLVRQTLVPGCAHVDASREDGDETM